VFDYYKDFETVMDLFGGSGFNLIAAENKGKKAFIMEYEPHYTDVIVKRWQDYTGKEAILESTSETFNSFLVEGEHSGS
jgi:DNA modification methylase